jgi:3-hydroxyisobutyrate dehydrogenase-like beta-hydroxyacid dehydrogenase
MHVGFLGVGNMGQPMAGRLLDGGHALTVHDLNETNVAPLLARQARRVDTPRAMADAAEIVVVSLPTLKAFRQVVFGDDGLLQGSAMRILINTCTVGVPFVTEISAALAKVGCTLVDCPISGGPSGAAAGTLSVMVSGDPAAIEQVRPLLALWGSTITVAGDTPGAAQLLKLTNNILFAVSLVATAEAFVMGAKGGLDPAVMVQAINGDTGANGATRGVMPRSVLPRTFAYGATLNILMKDVDLAIEQGEELGVPMWICQAARLVYKHAVMAGRGNDDLSRMVEIVEQAAGFAMPMVPLPGAG